MKKFLQKSLILTLLTGILCSAEAQVIIHEELFEETLGSWTSYSVTGDAAWESGSFSGQFFAEINAFDSGNFPDNEDWLISPAINLDMYEDEVLTFENAENFAGPDLELFYSTDYPGPSSDPSTNGTWIDITDQATWSPGGYEFVSSGEIDLSGIEGNQVYFGFKYLASNDLAGKLWRVDSLIIKGNMTSNVKEVNARTPISQPYVTGNDLQFDILGSVNGLSFEIYDLTGQQMSSYDAQAFGSRASLPVGNLPKGMYVLIARSGNSVQAFKFFK